MSILLGATSGPYDLACCIAENNQYLMAIKGPGGTVLRTLIPTTLEKTYEQGLMGDKKRDIEEEKCAIQTHCVTEEYRINNDPEKPCFLNLVMEEFKERELESLQGPLCTYSILKTQKMAAKEIPAGYVQLSDFTEHIYIDITLITKCSEPTLYRNTLKTILFALNVFKNRGLISARRVLIRIREPEYARQGDRWQLTGIKTILKRCGFTGQRTHVKWVKGELFVYQYYQIRLA